MACADSLCNFHLTIGSKILEILVSEDENFPLSGVQGELVETLLIKLTNLHTLDLSADVWGDVLGGSVCEQVRLCGVSPASSIDVFCARSTSSQFIASRIEFGSGAYRKSQLEETFRCYQSVDNRTETEVHPVRC
jgi:hypothetical protein